MSFIFKVNVDPTIGNTGYQALVERWRVKGEELIHGGKCMQRVKCSLNDLWFARKTEIYGRWKIKRKVK